MNKGACGHPLHPGTSVTPYLGGQGGVLALRRRICFEVFFLNVGQSIDGAAKASNSLQAAEAGLALLYSCEPTTPVHALACQS